MNAPAFTLPSRWSPLKPHIVQSAYFRSPHRFNIVPAGRRSGKTELAKRKLIKAFIKGTTFDRARFFAAAPIRDQAKKIYWSDLKSLMPREFVSDILEGELTIKSITGSELVVLGMDKPERIEGQPWDGGVLDEYGNMKEKAWPENVRPALSDRKGWCDFIGVPEGRNHYYELYLDAKKELAEFGNASPWGVYEWESADILDPAEVEAARKDLHPKIFEQEYQGRFVDFSGLALFDIEKWFAFDIVRGELAPVPMPQLVDAVYAIIDTAVKTGKANDGTAVIYFGTSRFTGHPLTILDWDIVQIEGALLEGWLAGVFTRLEELTHEIKCRQGSAGALIEDRQSGSILIQQAQHRGWNARPLPETLTSIGKDERAIAISGHHYAGKVKITQAAYDKVVAFKEKPRNHLLRQVGDFRLGDKDAATRADDLLDAYTYGVSVALGDSEGL